MSRFPSISPKGRDLQATSGWKGRRPSLRHDCQWEGETRRSSTSSLVAWCCYRFVLYIPHQWRWKTTGMLWWPTVRKRLMRLEQSDWLIWLYPDLPVTFEIGNQDTLPKNLEFVACLTRRGMESVCNFVPGYCTGTANMQSVSIVFILVPSSMFSLIENRKCLATAHSFCWVPAGTVYDPFQTSHTSTPNKRNFQKESLLVLLKIFNNMRKTAS